MPGTVLNSKQSRQIPALRKCTFYSEEQTINKNIEKPNRLYGH